MDLRPITFDESKIPPPPADPSDVAQCYRAWADSPIGSTPRAMYRAMFRYACHDSGQTADQIQALLGIGYPALLALVTLEPYDRAARFEPSRSWLRRWNPPLQRAWSEWTAARSDPAWYIQRARLAGAIRNCLDHGATIAWIACALNRKPWQIYRWLEVEPTR